MTTQGNATDARPNAREWLLADLDRRIEEGRAATPGPWSADANAVRDPERYALALTYPRREPPYDPAEHRANAAYISACSPDRMVAVWEWARGEVGRHRWTPWADADLLCGACQHSGPRATFVCRFVAGLASALGYPGEGGAAESIVCQDYPDCAREHAGGAGGVPVHPPAGSRVSGDEVLIPDAPQTGDSERGTPAAQAGDAEGSSEPNGPAAVAATLRATGSLHETPYGTGYTVVATTDRGDGTVGAEAIGYVVRVESRERGRRYDWMAYDNDGALRVSVAWSDGTRSHTLYEWERRLAAPPSPPVQSGGLA